jgi:hypothetical protein
LKKKRDSWLIVVGAIATLTCSTAFADMLFQDDFESDLSAWTGKTGDVHHGVIVDDPLNAGNHVLTFTQKNAYGDIFTTQAFDLVAGQEYIVSFDYLGFDGKTPGHSGGFAGLSSDYPGTHIWYYGTTSTSQANPILIGDGQWHHYDYTFTAPLKIGDSIHLMFEDFIGIGGDAYFDNIAFHAPVPGALLLGSMGLSLAGWRLKKKRA